MLTLPPLSELIYADAAMPILRCRRRFDDVFATPMMPRCHAGEGFRAMPPHAAAGVHAGCR